MQIVGEGLGHEINYTMKTIVELASSLMKYSSCAICFRCAVKILKISGFNQTPCQTAPR